MLNDLSLDIFFSFPDSTQDLWLNIDSRFAFPACSVQINSEKTHREDALHVVDNAKPKVYPVNLTDDKSCQVDTTASKYQKCGEEWRALSPSGNLTRFSLLGDSNKGYKLKV